MDRPTFLVAYGFNAGRDAALIRMSLTWGSAFRRPFALFLEGGDTNLARRQPERGTTGTLEP